MSAHSLHIVLQTVSDSFAPQEVTSYDIPPQRVLTTLPVFLRLIYLLVIQGNPELLDARRIFFLLRNKSRLNVRLCKHIATGFSVAGKYDERDIEFDLLV